MNEDTWEKARQILDDTPEPSNQEMLSASSNSNCASHEFGKQNHSLVRSIYDFRIKEFEAQYILYVCPNCRKVWSKSFVVFNNKTNSSYTKEIYKKGKPVEEGGIF